jgi:hypothetical protein
MTSGKPLDSAQNPIFERHRIRPGPALTGLTATQPGASRKTCSFLPRSQIRSNKRFHGAGGLHRRVNGHDGSYSDDARYELQNAGTYFALAI